MGLHADVALLLAAAAICTGCAELQVFDEKGEQTGIRFYTSKPYLLVAFTGNNDKPVDVSVQHLPDVAHPYYARPRSGIFGTSTLQMNFQDGKLTSFGQTVDSGTAGALTAIGDFQKALAEVARARMEARAKGEALPNFRLYEIYNEVNVVKLREVVIDATATPQGRR